MWRTCFQLQAVCEQGDALSVPLLFLTAKWRLLSKTIETNINKAEITVRCICLLRTIIIDIEGTTHDPSVLEEISQIRGSRQARTNISGRSFSRSSKGSIDVRNAFKAYFNGSKKSRGIPRQTEVALGVPGIRPRIFSTFCTTRVVVRQPNAPAAFTPGEIPGAHFQRLSRPQGTWICRKEPRKKSQVTTPGIDPGTVRVVAQRLNHYATPGPLSLLLDQEKKHRKLGGYIYIYILIFFTL